MKTPPQSEPHPPVRAATPKPRFGWIGLLLLVASVWPAITVPGHATTYYVSSSTGNDANAGTSSSAPWATLAKVNGFSFAPADTIRFKAGDIWRGQLVPRSGSSLGYITYNSYGVGKKPQIWGSVAANGSGAWTNTGTNLWSTAANSCPTDVGSLIFEGGASFGVKMTALSYLTQPNQFWYDATRAAVVMYSTSNPGSLYSSIECALKGHVIQLASRSYVAIDGLSVSRGGSHGISGTDCSFIVITNCYLSYIGGSYLSGTTRYGNAIQFYSNAHDCTVTDNVIYNIYDTGITNQGSGTNQQYNLYYRNNNISNCEWSFELWDRESGSSMNNIYFENNVCQNAGVTWAHAQRPDPMGAHIMLWGSNASAANIYVRYNTFDTSSDVCVNLTTGSYGWTDIANLTIDFNTYSQGSGNFARWNGVTYSISQFGAYKTATGKDANSTLNGSL